MLCKCDLFFAIFGRLKWMLRIVYYKSQFLPHASFEIFHFMMPSYCYHNHNFCRNRADSTKKCQITLIKSYLETKRQIINRFHEF